MEKDSCIYYTEVNCFLHCKKYSKIHNFLVFLESLKNDGSNDVDEGS